MLRQNRPQETQQDCKITDKLFDLLQKGYKMPWISKDGIAPFQALILKELIRRQEYPGSIGCIKSLDIEYGIDAAKIKAAAGEILSAGEYVEASNFWKVAMRALEKEITAVATEDLHRAERLLACYAAGALRDRCCHAESVNGLLTVTYEAEQAFSGHPSLRVVHLLDTIKAWRSGLLCGVYEECLRMKEQLCGRSKVACSAYVNKIDHVSSLYLNLKGAISNLHTMQSEIIDSHIKETMGQLENICSDLLCSMGKLAPEFDDTAADAPESEEKTDKKVA